MKTIPLTKGQVAMVDDEDYAMLTVRKWQAQPSSCGYAAVGKVNGKKILMARLIMGFPEGMEVDHRDGNRLNNQKSNLRLVTHSQNQRNQNHLRADNKTGYKGAFWNALTKRYEARIWIDKRSMWLGAYKTAEDAARAYDAAAIEHFGEFAAVNFKTEVRVVSAVPNPELRKKSKDEPKKRGKVPSKTGGCPRGYNCPKLHGILFCPDCA